MSDVEGLTAAAVKFITELTLPWMHVLSVCTCAVFVLIGLKLCRLLWRAYKSQPLSLQKTGASLRTDGTACEAEESSAPAGGNAFEIKENAFFKYFFALCSLAAAAFALYLSFAVLPFTPQVFDDEISFWSLAEGLSREGLYISKLENPPLEFFLPIPPACPYVLSLFFGCFGVCEKAVLFCALASAVWSLAAAYLWALLYWRKSYCAFIFIFFLCFLPVHVRLLNTNALENGSMALVFTFLLILELIPFIKDLFRASEPCAAESPCAGESACAGEAACFEKLCIYGAALAAAWLADWRMENAPVIVPLCFLVYLCHDLRRFRIFKNPHFYGALTLTLLFSLPGLACNGVGMLKGYYLFYDAPETLSRMVAQNSLYNWLYWVNGAIHPLTFTLLAALGLFFFKNRQKFLWLAAWLLSVLFYSRIPSADFCMLSHLDSWRNAVFPAFCMLAAGVCVIKEARPLFKSLMQYGAAVLLIMGVIVWQLFSHWQFVVGRNMYIDEYIFFRGLRVCSFLDRGLLFYDIDSEIPCIPVDSALKYRLASEREWFEAVWDKEDDGLKEAPVVLRDIERRCQGGVSTVMYRSCVADSKSGIKYREVYDRCFIYKKIAENISFGVYHDIIVIKGLTPEGRAWLERGGGK